jgi:site-specific recombinase XerC
MFGKSWFRLCLRKFAAHKQVVTRKDRLDDLFLADSKTYAHLRALDPELPDHAWQVILRYRPQLSTVQWNAVREFTIENAVRMRPRTFENVRRLMTMSARFNAWVWTTTGTALTVERVYTQNNVYRYLQACLPKHSEGHRWGFVRQLGVIADTLAGTDVKRMPAPKVAGRRPFTMSEVATMHSWASSLTTELKRQNAWAVLGLAGGAGLRSEEIVEISVSDIDVVDGRVFVNVPGRRARRIPVMSPWNRTLLRSIQNRPNAGDDVFRGYRLEEYRPRAIQNFLTDHPARVRATVSRLRSTWLVAQIEKGLDVQVLKYIAGVSSSASLEKHIAFARTPNVDDYIGLIIGEEANR